MTQLTRIVLGRVNCYLVPADCGYVLIDTGEPKWREGLEQELRNVGCRPGDLRLIVLTHGDYRHAGNASYLRDQYETNVAMHREDLARVRRGDWAWGLKAEPDRSLPLFRMSARLSKPGPFDLFEPDVCLDDGQSLLRYGCDATVLRLPGHTKGSIGLLTADNDVICGDLMSNVLRPRLYPFINDMAAARVSMARLRRLKVDTVHPGHGRPFSFDRFKGDQ